MAKKSPVIKPKIDWSKSQADWSFPLRIPSVKGKLRGPSVMAKGRIVSTVSQSAIDANEHIVIAFHGEWAAKWCEAFDRLLCAFEADGVTLVAIRKATDADDERLRAPSFIQSDEWPVCCKRSMSFVGQIDDETVADDPPPGAKLWWHDAASFYVFTCPVCLECKAVGQQC